MRVMIFQTNDDRRLMQVEDAAASGFQCTGDEIMHSNRHDHNLVVDDRTQLAVFVGRNEVNAAMFKAHVRAGRHVLLIDEGYIDPDKYWRFGLDGHQSPFLHRKRHDPMRLAECLAGAGLKLEPHKQYTSTQDTYVYVGASEEDCRWFNLGPPHEFDSNLIRKLVDKTINRQFKILWYARWKQDNRDIYMPRKTALLYGDDAEVRKQFKNARVIVTHSNRLSIEALLAGKPVGILSSDVASPIHDVCETNFEKMWQPHPPRDREQALYNLANWQFTLDEIASGHAMIAMMPYTIKRLEDAARKYGVNSEEYLVGQYQLMHELPNRYRGGLQEDVLVHIGQMVARHKPKNLLDYGSGKGRQYGELAQHELWGGPKPDCYDPGVPAFSKLPKAQSYDGVICTDVAEHIPEARVHEFIGLVHSCAKKFAVWCIYTGLAAKVLPDGRNAHLTVRPSSWWLQKLVNAPQFAHSHCEITGSEEKGYLIRNPNSHISGTNFEVAVVFRSKDGK